LVTGSAEAEWRTAVSRAYYAVFHAARAILILCGFDVPRSERAHGYLWLRLTNSGHPDVELAGERLNNLRGVRNQSDYELAGELKRSKAVRQVQTAHDVMSALDAAALEPTRTQISAAMRVYERDVLKEVTWHV
jgi:uncharacterized protein (UPF0332 family)